jgi:hypothetical protein
MDYGAITPRSLRSALEYYTDMLPEKICAWRMRHGLPVAMATVMPEGIQLKDLLTVSPRHAVTAATINQCGNCIAELVLWFGDVIGCSVQHSTNQPCEVSKARDFQVWNLLLGLEVVCRVACHLR